MFSALSNFVFSASSLFSPNNQAYGIKTSTWKDKKLGFDLSLRDLELDRGEQLIGCFYPIEDVKGNEDELGLIRVTNLRLIWMGCRKLRMNLSIGWRTVTLAYEQGLKDTLNGCSSSMFVLSKYDSTKYEFVFRRRASQIDIWADQDIDQVFEPGRGAPYTAIEQLRQFAEERGHLVSHLSPMYLDNPFEVIFKVWQAYKQTHLFRHCRSNLTYLVALNSSDSSGGGGGQQSSSLKLSDIQKLPSEEIIEVFSGVAHNESRSVKYIGTMLLSNIRIIWIDESIQMRNFSIPYIRVDSIKLRPGDRIHVNTHDHLAGSSHVEFQIQKNTPSGTISKSTKTIFEQLQNLYLLYKSKPRYGPESCEDSINFMSHMRPIGQFFASIDKSWLKTVENYGSKLAEYPDRTDIQVTEVSASVPASKQRDDQSDDIERAESDLSGYTKNMIKYLNEKPLNNDEELIYSNDD